MLVNFKKDILTYASTWMTLEGVMPNEITQSQKDKYCMIHLNNTERNTHPVTSKEMER